MTLNVANFSHTYTQILPKLLPEFEARTGIEVVYDTPSFPVYYQRADLEFSTRGAAYGSCWVADAMHAGAARFDIVQKAGFGMPDDWDQLRAKLQATHRAGSWSSTATGVSPAARPSRRPGSRAG